MEETTGNEGHLWQGRNLVQGNSMESMRVTLSDVMVDAKPEQAIFCNQGRLQVEGFDYQPRHKTFDQ